MPTQWKKQCARDINTLFKVVNNELTKLAHWFKANKLSLNASKTKYTFFHKLNARDDIPLKLPILSINKVNIKRERSMKFLGVILDENITWKEHIKLIENKIAKNIGILYKAKFLLNQTCLRNIYYSFIHCYLNYANIAWCSTNRSKLTKLFNKQKHASRIIFNVDKFTHSRPLMKNLNVLNVYQINIYQSLIFMYKFNNKMTPTIFNTLFKKIEHAYPTRFSNNNFVQPKTFSKTTNFSISKRGPYLWNTLLDNDTKSILTLDHFKTKVKQELLMNDNETNFF